MKNKFNINIALLLVGILFLLTTTKAQRRVEFTVTAADSSGVKIPILVGVDDRATDSLDASLGEQFLPPIHPPAPSAIHAVVLVENQFCNKSYRRIPIQNQFSLDYTINVNDYSKRNAPFFFEWNYPLPEHIDSAKIMDRLGGVIYSFPLDASKSFLITNEGLVNFNLVIWYNLPPSSVIEDDTDLSNERCIVQTQNDDVIINTKEKCTVKIFSTLATELWDEVVEGNSTKISTSTLMNGVYFVVLTFSDGTISTKKILISR